MINNLLETYRCKVQTIEFPDDQQTLRFRISLAKSKITACSFRWFIVAESIIHWFVVREKHCWMAADSAE
jgi:hypothetical protein